MAYNPKNDEIWKNIEKLNVEDYEKVSTFIIENPELTTKECIDKIDFHKFTEDSFEYFIKQVNENRLTFNKIGPFKKNNNKWVFAGKVKKEDQIDLINRLKLEIETLKKQLYYNKTLDNVT